MSTDATDKGTSWFKITFTLVVSGTEGVTDVIGNSCIRVAAWLPTGPSGPDAKTSCWWLRPAAARLLRALATGLDDAGEVFQSPIPGRLLTKTQCMYLSKSSPCFSLMKRKITVGLLWLLRLSLFISLCLSFPCSKDSFNVYVNSSTHPLSSSTEKKYVTETSVVNLVLLCNLGVFILLTMFTLAATLLIINLKRHTLHMGSNATGSRDPSMEAHLGGIRAISCLLILYVFSAVALFLSLSVTDAHSYWNILCKIIMAAYPAGHVLLILGNPGLRRAWKRFQCRVHIFTYQGRLCGWNPQSTWSKQLGLFLT
ncbi:LOW QUALITY PROTEIN: taste receptor type 2 member 40 [Hipposideros larvatus]